MKMALVMFWSVINADEQDSLASIIQSFYCKVLDRNSMIYFPLSADVHQEIAAVLVPYLVYPSRKFGSYCCSTIVLENSLVTCIGMCMRGLIFSIN